MSSPTTRWMFASWIATVLPIQLFAAGTPEPVWGLPAQLSAKLAEQADRYQQHRRSGVGVETVRSRRFRADPPGEPYAPAATGELRFQVRQFGRARKKAPRRVRAFPSADDWALLFSARNQSFFIYRELGTRLEGFDLVREIQFRGWLPFSSGHDIREWEGIALVEASRCQLVEIRAEPRNQKARLPCLYDKWSRSFKITFGIFAGPFFIPGKTFRLARPPLAFHGFARFDDREEDLRLPSELTYEIHRAVSRDQTFLKALSTRRYVRPAP